jgi:hypothetical protein
LAITTLFRLNCVQITRLEEGRCPVEEVVEVQVVVADLASHRSILRI